MMKKPMLNAIPKSQNGYGKKAKDVYEKASEI